MCTYILIYYFSLSTLQLLQQNLCCCCGDCFFCLYR